MQLVQQSTTGTAADLRQTMVHLCLQYDSQKSDRTQEEGQALSHKVSNGWRGVMKKVSLRRLTCGTFCFIMKLWSRTGQLAYLFRGHRARLDSVRATA